MRTAALYIPLRLIRGRWVVAGEIQIRPDVRRVKIEIENNCVHVSGARIEEGR